MNRLEAVLADARRRIEPRIEPEAFDIADPGALVVDIRPDADRAADGELAGALVIDRNVLEWRLDPTSGHAVAEADADKLVVLVCNEGYASSLAAAALVDLGLRATDLAGGYRALVAARAAESIRVGSPPAP